MGPNQQNQQTERDKSNDLGTVSCSSVYLDTDNAGRTATKMYLSEKWASEFINMLSSAVSQGRGVKLDFRYEEQGKFGKPNGFFFVSMREPRPEAGFQHPGHQPQPTAAQPPQTAPVQQQQAYPKSYRGPQAR